LTRIILIHIHTPHIRMQARFDELMKSVDENQVFLGEMEALGLKGKYVHTVNAEISSKIREMNEIDGKLAKR
jgi:hypothetical protein